MQISLLISCWCFVVKKVVSQETTFNSVDVVSHTYEDDKLLIRGHFVNSSDIKALINSIMNHRTIQKVHVYVVNTFYVDDDLEMRGIRELYILANTWIISRAVAFDLSGLDGRKPALSTVKGSAGNPGEEGKSGANFLGLANEVINVEFLTVKLNGGNGGEGQDGTASDNVRVTLNTRVDCGKSEWFSSADLLTYYQHYFKDKGYDADMSHLCDYNSFYALLSHNKEASFLVTLQPINCCGKTGMGGEGGLGGRSGKSIFMQIGQGKVTDSPKFVAREGWTGNPGKNARPCRTIALNIRVTTKLETVVFLSVPLHHSFSSEFSEVGPIISLKCPMQFVKGNGAVLESEQHQIETVSAITEYKTFLLDQMNNRSLVEIIQRTIEAIDSNSEINSAYTVNDFVVEANALEKRFLDLCKYVNLKQLYERLSERIQARENRSYCDNCTSDDSSKNSLSLLNSILAKRLNDFPRQYLIFGIDSYFESQISYIKRVAERFVQYSNINDLELQTNINQLQFHVNANNLLSSYFTITDLYKFAFFPFAAQFYGMFQLSSSLESYEDFNAVFSTVTNNLKSMIEHIPELDDFYSYVFINKTTLGNNDPENYCYKWKYSEVRNEIRQLFAGEKIRLFADIKRSDVQLRKHFNAFRFSEINLVFRSSNKRINDELNQILSSSCVVMLNHTGQSDIRCNDDLYRFTTGTLEIMYCPPINESTTNACVGTIYDSYQNNYPLLSPYTHWNIELRSENRDLFRKLAKFVDVHFDIELHCTGKYLRENDSICNDMNVANIYSLL